MSKLNRRRFLFSSAMAAAGVALASCAPRPAEPAEPAVPATPVPVAPVAPVAPVEPEVVIEKESPMLATMVAAGTLPPLEERLPENPLVLTPLHEIGKYGGTVRTFHMNLGAGTQTWMYGPSPLRWINDGHGIAPGMVERWEANADNSEWTLHLRKGLKWSDGAPCTVDDVMYAYTDLVENEDHPDPPTEFYTGAGAPVTMTKVDDFTVTLAYVGPAPLIDKRLAMWVKAGIGPRWIAPKHYLQEFHPTYNPAVADFVEHDLRLLWRQFPGSPTLAAWMCESFEPGLRRIYTRNPYYYCVDPDGRQLPYWDKIDESAIEDKEVQMLTIIQGGADYLSATNHRGTLADIAPLTAGQPNGKYRLHLIDGGGGSGHYYFWNWDAPEENYRWLYRNPQFKMAFNYLRDRPRITRTIYFGLGELTTGTMSPKAIEFNYNDEAREWYRKQRDAYIEYDPERAAALLDEIGVIDADGDGFRDFPDGSPLELRVEFGAGASPEWHHGHEITVADFAKVGLRMTTVIIPDAEVGPSWRSGREHIRGAWGVGDGPDHLVFPSWVVPDEPNRWAPLCGNFYLARGTEAARTEADLAPWDRSPPRWLETEKDMIGETVLELQELLDTALSEVDYIKRMELVWQMIQIHIDNGTFGSGTTANLPRIFIYGENVVNAPSRAELATGGFADPWIVPHPAIHNPETFAFI